MTAPEEPGHIPITTLSTDDVILVAPDATLAEAARLMVEGEVGLVVVGRPDQVSGVVSERDVVRAVAAGRDMATTLVAQVAHTEIVWCETTAPVVEVATEMMEEYVRHVLVEEDGRLVGIVSARDLLGAYTAADRADA